MQHEWVGEFLTALRVNVGLLKKVHFLFLYPFFFIMSSSQTHFFELTAEPVMICTGAGGSTYGDSVPL